MKIFTDDFIWKGAFLPFFHKNWANLRLPLKVQKQKVFQLQGGLHPPYLPTRGSVTGPRWGLRPQTPVIGSGSARSPCLPPSPNPKYATDCVPTNWSQKTIANNCGIFGRLTRGTNISVHAFVWPKGIFEHLLELCCKFVLTSFFLVFWTVQNYQCYFARYMRILLFLSFSVSQDRFKVWRKI